MPAASPPVSSSEIPQWAAYLGLRSSGRGIVAGQARGSIALRLAMPKPATSPQASCADSWHQCLRKSGCSQRLRSQAQALSLGKRAESLVKLRADKTTVPS
jgi:hypothetical protein